MTDWGKFLEPGSFERAEAEAERQLTDITSEDQDEVELQLAIMFTKGKYGVSTLAVRYACCVAAESDPDLEEKMYQYVMNHEVVYPYTDSYGATRYIMDHAPFDPFTERYVDVYEEIVHTLATGTMPVSTLNSRVKAVTGKDSRSYVERVLGDLKRDRMLAYSGKGRNRVVKVKDNTTFVDATSKRVKWLRDRRLRLDPSA